MSSSAFSPWLSEAFLDLLLYKSALDLFEDDPSLSVILHKHLLETLAAPILDKLIQTLVMDNKLKSGIKIEDGENFDAAQLTSANSISLVKSLPDPLSAKTLAVIEALEGKHVDTFIAAFKDLAEESGLLLKKLDNKLEVSLLQSYGKDLTSQISSETDPLVLLPKIVALLYLQAATEDEEDCTADRILSKREYLESKTTELKGLVLKTTNSEADSVASEMHASH